MCPFPSTLHNEKAANLYIRGLLKPIDILNHTCRVILYRKSYLFVYFIMKTFLLMCLSLLLVLCQFYFFRSTFSIFYHLYIPYLTCPSLLLVLCHCYSLFDTLHMQDTACLRYLFFIIFIIFPFSRAPFLQLSVTRNQRNYKYVTYQDLSINFW